MGFNYLSSNNNRQRVTQAKKNFNDKQWYKEQADLLDHHSFSGNMFAAGGVSEFKRKKTNYDLYNNIININDFSYVCKPFGSTVGDLPAEFANRDIVSGKIKVLLGMEMKMPFSWQVIAVNEEATTRKEQQEAKMIRDYVTAQIMNPIRKQIEAQELAQTKGRKLTPEEQRQLEQDIDEQTAAKTPDEVRKYMTREHQDPAETLNQQLLEYLLIEKRINHKFNKGFKHNLLSGEDIYWVGILNGEPDMEPVNSLYFDYDKSPDLDFVEDGEWAVREIWMTPSEIVSKFGPELTNAQIDKIYDRFSHSGSAIRDEQFTFDNSTGSDYTVRVIHTTWKSLMKIGFLTYLDKSGDEQMMIVNEDYRISKENGDISLEWEWLPEAHEAYKIMSDIYCYCRPVPGQNKDLDNLWTCKLPYYGSALDSLNSPVTAPVDRMKAYQYYYDIIWYRIELLMASDKGKILLANIKAIPKSSGINLNKFMYYMEANKIAWFNPNEEGNKGQPIDAGSVAKEIDMSLVSDISKYIEVAEYVEKKCGQSIGVTPQMEAQIAAGDAVSNTRQNLVQASYMIQPIFELHNTVKGNVLNALLNTAKVAYSRSKPRKLSYVLDDMSYRMITIDTELLDNNTCGLFVSNSSKASDAKQAVENLSQAALQNQQADLGDIIKIIKSNSIHEAEELLEAAQARKAQELQAIEKAKLKQQQQDAAAAQQQHLEDQAHEEKMIVLKETERRKTIIQQSTIAALGFAKDTDQDDDGVPDVLEVAKYGVEADIKRGKLALDERAQSHQEGLDKEKLKLERQKVQIARTKSTKAS